MKLLELSIHDYLIINAGILFTGSSVKRNVRIHIWGGKVLYIEESPFKGKLLTGKECRVIGGAGMTVLPGLIDCHVHLALDGVHHDGEKPLCCRERLQEKLDSDLAHGVVAVRDGGDKNGIGFACRGLVRRRELQGPVIMAAGQALRKDGRYGSFLGAGVTSGELAQAVNRLCRCGVDHIKVLVSGIVSFKEYGRVGSVQFDLRELKQIVRVAGEHGLKVMAHASSDQAVRLCIQAGVHSIEHGYFISEDSLQAMAEKGIAWVPTVVPVAVQNQGMSGDGVVGDIAVIEGTYRRQLEMINLAQQLGVILGVGTDAGATGVRHGAGLLQELQLYREAGLTAEEVMMTATRNGAYILGINDLGVIAPGKPAFLLAVQGDPFQKIEALSNIEYLIRPVQESTAESSCQPA